MPNRHVQLRHCPGNLSSQQSRYVVRHVREPVDEGLGACCQCRVDEPERTLSSVHKSASRTVLLFEEEWEENVHANSPDDGAAIAHDGSKELRELIPSLLLRRCRTDTGSRLRFVLAVLCRRLFGSRPDGIVGLDSCRKTSAPEENFPLNEKRKRKRKCSTYIPTRQLPILQPSQIIRPQLRPRIPTGLARLPQGNGTTPLNGLDDARVDVRDPRPGRAYALGDEEFNHALDGAELVRRLERSEVLGLHVAHVVEPGRHAAGFDLLEGAAEGGPACRVGGDRRLDGDERGGRGVAFGEGLREGGTEAEAESAQAEEREDGGGLHRDCIFDRSLLVIVQVTGDFEFSRDSISSRRALKKLYPLSIPHHHHHHPPPLFAPTAARKIQHKSLPCHDARNEATSHQLSHPTFSLPSEQFPSR